MVQGQTATVTVSASGSSKEAVSLSVANVPDSITATLNPTSLSGNASSSTLTIATGLKAPIGTATLTVRGRVSGDSATTSVALTVTPAPGVTVTKAGSGSGTVTSSPAGINCGSVCSTQFAVGTSVTLTAAPAAGSVFASWAGACSGTTLTCTLTPVVNNGNSVTATFNSSAPGMALAVSPSPVSVTQGTSGTATVTVTRINGFANPVALTVNAPAGLTVAANPSSVTGTTSALTISAGSSLAVGSYSVGITATAPGVTQQTANLVVQVTPASQGAAITFNFANCETSEIPIWLAVQSGNGPWTRITPANNAFTFTPGATGAIALVTRDGTTTETQVLYASGAELTSLAIAGYCAYTAPTGTKRITGTLANTGVINQGYKSLVTVGGSSYLRTSDFIQTFTLPDVPKGPRDLVASRHNGLSNNNRMILRRGTNYANNAQVPLIDFGSVEAFVPAGGSVTISNLPDTLSIDVSLITTNGSSAPYYSDIGIPGPGGGARALFFGLPDTLLQSGDFHAISVFAGSGTSFRFVQLLERSVTAKTTAFGPQLGTGTKITTLGTTPYLRLRAQVPTLATYTSGASIGFEQNTNAVSLLMTAAYLTSTPATWTVDIPDLSSAGYDANWGLKNGVGVSWSASAVSALNGNLLPLIGGAPADNVQLTGAGVADSSATFSASWRHPFGRRPRH